MEQRPGGEETGGRRVRRREVNRAKILNITSSSAPPPTRPSNGKGPGLSPEESDLQ